MDEVRVNIGGAEMELRPISARQYLSACAEAEKMSESFADDLVSKAILLGAALLSKGLFYDGQRIFSDGNEVLDAFSAHEITDTAGYIDLEPARKVNIVETGERVKKAGQSKEIDNISSDTVEGFTAKPVSKRKLNDFFNVNTERSEGHDKESTQRSCSPISDMRSVSDFFQRDSRRYDGIISSY